MSNVNKKKFRAPVLNKAIFKHNDEKIKIDDVEKTVSDSASTANLLWSSGGEIEDVDYLPSSQASASVSLSFAHLKLKKEKRFLSSTKSKHANKHKSSEQRSTTKKQKLEPKLDSNENLKHQVKKPKFFNMEDIIKNRVQDKGNKKISRKAKELLPKNSDTILAPLSKNKKLSKKRNECYNNAKEKNSSKVTRSQHMGLSQPPRSLRHRDRLIWLQERRGIGLWVQCDEVSCNKWRFLKDVSDPTTLSSKWYCFMNNDIENSRCVAPEEPLSALEEEDLIHNIYTAGSLVWARLDGFPWWPAMVDDCPDTEMYYWLNGFSDIPTYYNVVFFDIKEVTRGWVTPPNLCPFSAKRPHIGKIQYKKRIQHAVDCAVRASKLSIKDRLKQYSFLALYKGPILSPVPTPPDSDDEDNIGVKQTSILKMTSSSHNQRTNYSSVNRNNVDVYDRITTSLKSLIASGKSIHSSQSQHNVHDARLIDDIINIKENKRTEIQNKQKIHQQSVEELLESKNLGYTSPCSIILELDKKSEIKNNLDVNSTNMDSHELDTVTINCSPDIFTSQKIPEARTTVLGRANMGAEGNRSESFESGKAFRQSIPSQLLGMVDLISIQKTLTIERSSSSRLSVSQPTVSSFSHQKLRNSFTQPLNVNMKGIAKPISSSYQNLIISNTIFKEDKDEDNFSSPDFDLKG